MAKSTTITTYKELIAEKERLEALAKLQQQQIRDDFSGLKAGFRSSIGLFVTRKAGHVLANLGINVVIDILVKRKLLSKANWLLRQIVPFVLKNFASHLVDKPEKIIERIVHMFRKNGKERQEGMEAV